jgi:hypothetical protein
VTKFRDIFVPDSFQIPTALVSLFSCARRVFDTKFLPTLGSARLFELRATNQFFGTATARIRKHFPGDPGAVSAARRRKMAQATG